MNRSLCLTGTTGVLTALLLFCLLPVCVEAQGNDDQVSRLTFKTLKGTGAERSYETDSLTVKVENKVLTISGFIESSGSDPTEYQELKIRVPNFEGRGTYTLRSGQATWEDRNTGDGLCHFLFHRKLVITSYDPVTGIEGNFHFICESQPRVGNSFRTDVIGEFIKGLEPKVTYPAERDTLDLFDDAKIEWQLPGRDLVDIYVVYEPDPERPGIEKELVVEDVDASLGFYEWEAVDSMSPQVYLLIYDDLDPDVPIISEEFVIRGSWAARVRNDPSGDCPTCPYYELFYPSVHGFAHGNFTENFATRTRSDYPDRFDYAGGDDPFSILPYNFSNYIPVTGPDRLNYAGSGSFVEWENWVRAFGVGECYLTFSSGESAPRTDVVRLWAWYSGEWGGSCFGLAVASAMAFYNPGPFASIFSNSVTTATSRQIAGVPLTNALRDDISMMFSHQYGQAFQDKIRAGDWSVYDVRDEFAEVLSEDVVDGSVASNLLIGIQDDGGHALTAYALTLDDDNEDLWHLWVYDSNYPEDDDRSVHLDMDLGVWTYRLSESELWVGSEMILGDPLSNYFERAIIDFNPEFSDARAAFRFGIDVDAVDGSGETFSLSADGIFESDGEGAVPLYTFSGPGRPYAIRLASPEWHADLAPQHDSGVSMMIERPEHLLSFYSNTAKGDVDGLRWDHSSITAHNPDDSPRSISFEVIYRLENGTRTLGVSDLLLGADDSVRFSLLDDDAIVENYGGESTYTVTLRQQNLDGEFEGDYDPVDIGAGGRHRIDPPWWNLGTRLPIYVADGEGLENDTIIRINGLLGVNESRLVDGDLSITNPITDVGYLAMSLKQAGRVRVEAFDGLGRSAGDLYDGVHRAGDISLPIDARSLGAGSWILRTSVNNSVVGSLRVVRVD